MSIPNNTNPPTQTDGTGRGLIEQKADGTLEPPKNIISTVKAARTIYEFYRKAHLERILLYSQIEGLIAGNPPYDPLDLLEHGLSHVSNFNNLDGRALFDRAALSYWNLLYETDNFASISIGESADELKVSEILTEEFDKVVKQWPNFKTGINTLISQLVKFGVSPVFWPDERNWQWKVVELSRFFVSNEASTNTDELTCIAVESIFPAQYLFEAYMAAKKKIFKLGDDSTPWDTKELEYLLLLAANGFNKTTTQYQNFMDLQRAYQDGSFVWDAAFTDGIRLVSLFYREYDGKISHYMFDRYRDAGNFLYFIDRQYNSFEEALVIFTASPGEFCIHSNRGVGHKIFSQCQAIMQIDCAIVDMAKFTSTPFLKSLAVGSKDFEQIRVYPGTPTHIGTADFVQTNFGDNLSQLVSASQYLQGKMNYNAANSGDDPSAPDASLGSLSPTQARIQSFKEFNVLKNNIQHFYSFADFLVENMVSKMLRSEKDCPGYEYAKEWKEACITKGVPKEVFDTSDSRMSKINRKLPRGWTVKASRVAGDGSTVGTIMGLEAMNPILGSLGSKGQFFYTQLYIKSLFGQDYVDAFTQDMNSPDETSGGASLAQAENGLMMLGQSPSASPDNVQDAHIAKHFELGGEIIDRIKQQQMGVIEADKVFTVLIPHLHDHIQFYAKSPFAQTKIRGILDQFKQLQQYADFNRKNAQKQLQAQLKQRQEDQQQTQQVMSDAQRKDFVAQADIKRADAKVQSQVARGAEANQTRAEIMKTKVEKDAENQALDIRLKNQNKSQEIANKPQPKPASQVGFISDQNTSNLDNESTDNIRNEIARLGGNNPARDDFET